MKEGTSFFLRLEKGRIAGHVVSEEIRLSADGIVVGRPTVGDQDDVGIPGIKVSDDYVSRSHARLHYRPEEGCFVVEEKPGGSQNGTFVNGERIEPGRPCPLKDADLLGLAKVDGECRVVFRFRERNTTLASAISRDGLAAEDLAIDLAARRVWVRNREVPLRRKEFDLLAFLYRNRGEARSKDEIAEHVWAEEGGIVSPETIEINWLRITHDRGITEITVCNLAIMLFHTDNELYPRVGFQGLQTSKARAGCDSKRADTPTRVRFRGQVGAHPAGRGHP